MKMGQVARMLAAAVSLSCGAWGCASRPASTQEIERAKKVQINLSSEGNVTITGEGRTTTLPDDGITINPNDPLWPVFEDCLKSTQPL
ncbi:hypothetical protein HYR69_03855 [Candidatus Sumerlaeota bacterium]|nr:hypothetical protein [Candidatus Sumerlaeota bacterium]